MARPMLISDSTFTPPSSPRSTETSATAVIAEISSTSVVELTGTPNSSLSPALAWVAPKPSEVARPNSVANTARMSITWPGQPQIRSPSSG